MLTSLVTDVSPVCRLGSAIELRRDDRPGEDAPVFRTLLEPFWLGRRAHAYDQFCF